MRVDFSFKNFQSNESFKEFIDGKIEDLKKYLQHFEDGVLHLHGNIERNPHKEEYYTSFNLYLPKAVFHCRAIANRAQDSVNQAFMELSRQLEKQKSKFIKRFRNNQKQA